MSAAGNGRLSLTNLRFQVLLSRWASPCTSWVSARYPKWKWYYTSRSYSVINAENRLLIISIVRLKHPPPHLPEQPLLFLVPVYLKRRLPSIVTATIFHVHIPTHDAQIHETNKQPRIWIRTHSHRIKGIALWNVTRNNGHTNAHSQTLTLDACTRTGMHRFSLKLSVFRFLVAGITFTKKGSTILSARIFLLRVRATWKYFDDSKRPGIFQRISKDEDRVALRSFKYNFPDWFSDWKSPYRAITS